MSALSKRDCACFNGQPQKVYCSLLGLKENLQFGLDANPDRISESGLSFPSAATRSPVTVIVARSELKLMRGSILFFFFSTERQKSMRAHDEKHKKKLAWPKS